MNINKDKIKHKDRGGRGRKTIRIFKREEAIFKHTQTINTRGKGKEEHH